MNSPNTASAANGMCCLLVAQLPNEAHYEQWGRTDVAAEQPQTQKRVRGFQTI